MLAPSSAPVVAEAIGVHARTARRLLRTLHRNDYVERRVAGRRRKPTYFPSLRLLGLSAQLAARLPVVEHGREATRQAHEVTGLAAHLAAPSYGDVVVLASAGRDAPPPWSLMPAVGDAAGQVLLAYREEWRERVTTSAGRYAAAFEVDAVAIRDRGHAVMLGEAGGAATLAVPVSVGASRPIAALGVTGATTRIKSEEPSIASVLTRVAAELGGRVAAA